MALSGVHVAFGRFRDERHVDGGAHLRAATMSSETMSEPGTSTVTAPSLNDLSDSPVVSIVTTQDIFYSVALFPDAVNGPRDYLKAGESITRYCRHGDALAWVAA